MTAPFLFLLFCLLLETPSSFIERENARKCDDDGLEESAFSLLCDLGLHEIGFREKRERAKNCFFFFLY